MARAMRGVAPRPLVDRARFDHARICPLSGRLAGAACPGAIEEVFLPGTAPAAPGDGCDMHRLETAGGRARTVLEPGPEYEAWARAEGMEVALAAAPSTRPAGGAEGAAVRILLPADGDEYLVEAGVPREAQAIPVRVVAPRGTARVTLRSADGEQVLAPPFTGRLPARAGRHRLEVWLPGAAAPAAVSEFVVRGGGA